MNIEFKEITNDNVADICALEVFEHQKSFVAPNVLSLAEAYAYINEGLFAKPFGIYSNSLLIGFILMGYGADSDPDEPAIANGNYILWRLMIDKKFQGKGYANPVLQAAIGYIRTFPAGKADYVWLSYERENVHAKNIYEKFGFRENGEMCGEEIVAVYDLRKD